MKPYNKVYNYLILNTHYNKIKLVKIIIIKKIILEKIFNENNEYKKITTKMSEMRSKLSQSNIAHLIPPKQRKKSRYQNIKIISDWCIKILRFMGNDEEKTTEILENLDWIFSYKSII